MLSDAWSLTLDLILWKKLFEDGLKQIKNIPSWIDELYYTSMSFGDLLQYHVADDRFIGLQIPARAQDQKWSMYWFHTEQARLKFTLVLENEGFEVIIAEDTIMQNAGNHVVLTDFPDLNLRAFY